MATAAPTTRLTHHEASARAGRRLMWRAVAAAVLGISAAACAALRDGFPRPVAPVWALVLGQAVLLGGLGAVISAFDADGARRNFHGVVSAWGRLARIGVWTRRGTGYPSVPVVPPTRLDAMILLGIPAAGAAIALAGSAFGARLALDIASLLAVLLAMARLGVHVLRGINAPQLMLPVTFLILIFVGTVLLMLPRCAGDSDVRWVDALFTATSATCVTGLTVRSTATGFSPAGQGVIAMLIQLGGLGIVVFGATFAAFLRGTLSLREHVTVRDMLEHGSLPDLRGFVIRVIAITLVIQSIGAAAMYPMWADGAVDGPSRAWLSAFHSISAFCNAGFDITGDSLVPYRWSPLSLGVIGALVIVGGVGFPVLHDVGQWFARGVRRAVKRRRRPNGCDAARPRLTLHSRLTLATTALLLVGGAGLIALGQASGAAGQDGPGAWGRFGDAWFMSLTARTAGFNTVPMNEIMPATGAALMALMVVGGSPGSTAGGLKTTTLAVLTLATIATIRGRGETEVRGRSIPEALVRKAGALALCMFALVLASSISLLLSEPGRDPFRLVFESVSAATTTGLSLGETASLSDSGKLVLTVTMFLGRVGPLTLLGVLMIRRPPAYATLYPRENVTLG